jgi:integrase
VTSLLAAVGLPEARNDDEPAARLWAAIDEKFLAVVGWDPDWRVLTLPTDHPVLGRKACRIPGCNAPVRSREGLCRSCEVRRAVTPGISLAEFEAIPKPALRCVGVVACAVGGCGRPAKSTRAKLCNAHEFQRASVFCLPLEEFLAHPEVVPFASFGPCSAAACTRERDGRGRYCPQHCRRLRLTRLKDPGLDVEAWERTVPAVAEGLRISLRGLPDLVIAEVLYGLQERTRGDVKTDHIRLRPACDLLRRTQAASITEMEPDPADKHHGSLLAAFIKSVRRLGMSPETERHKDEWDLFVFGHSGTMTFTGISQPWLREAIKRWAFDDFPRHRGDTAPSVARMKVNSIGRLSESLRLQRADHGDVIRALGREDITAFCNRLAFMASQGQISDHTRVTLCRYARLVLSRCRSMGLTRPGQPLDGLPDDFAILSEDIPEEPEENLAGRDLPAEVMRVLSGHLDQLEASTCREARVAVELMMDTGRRPDEICSLDLGCLGTDPDGKLVLIYDNHKANRKGRRLPIAAATGAVITAQQERVRARFPGIPDTRLKLLPASTRNPAGRRSVNDDWISSCHRVWVSGFPEIVVPVAVDAGGRQVTKMLPFPKEKIFPYAYRHTYAQRHADAGVDVTVLQELMDHRQVMTTQGYYRVGAERRREAVDRVTVMQFDRQGNRVWRQAGALLASEHQRRAVSEVAVPYGGCTEPSNVAADGCDCPLRFRCIGCGHFKTDISYLPDLERYLADLLRHREKLRAAVDADEWARSEAMPSDNEITRVRRLIDRMKADLDDLTDAERAEIKEAVAVVRRGRNRVTSLGMPKVRQPMPDIRAERTA